MSRKSFKKHLLAYAAVGAFLVAQPQFAKAHDLKPLLSGFFMQLEGRYVMSDGDETPIAIGNDGRIFEIDMNNEDTTARFGMGMYIGNTGIDVGLHYSGLNISGTRNGHDCLPLTQITATPAYAPCVAPLIGNPALATTAFPLMSYVGGHNFEPADYDTTYHVVDFEVGYNLQLGRTSLRPFVGARYADFEQSVHTSGNFATAFTSPLPGVYVPLGGHADWSRLVTNRGAGPRLGLDAQVEVGAGFGFAGSISGSVLWGERDTVDSSNFGGVAVTSLQGGVPDGDDGDTFYNAEGDLGITYGVEMGNGSSMMMTLGYRVEAWFDVNNTSNSFSGLGPAQLVLFPATAIGAIGDTEADQIFHGPFMRAKLNF
ncbi:MAG: Lpg1974 family pore-forming outer membrane protein [Nitrospinales bacterium]